MEWYIRNSIIISSCNRDFAQNRGVFWYTEKTELSSGFYVRRYGIPEGEAWSLEL